MSDKSTYKDRLQQNAGVAGTGSAKKELEAEEVACVAAGFVRGIRDRAITVEFRFKNGNVCWFPNAIMAKCEFDPSEGILLRFSSDLLHLVLIKGSNLAMPVHDGYMTIIAGLQRHRVVWIREMSDAEVKSVGESAPTIDSIQVGQFGSHAEATEWIRKHAPAFAR